MRSTSAGLRYFEVFSVAVFTVEYLARLWVCTLDPRYGGAVRGRLRYARTPLAVIDLLAILPFYLPFFVAMDLRYLRALRLFRLFRILKMARYSVSLAIMARVVVRSREELLSTLFSAAVLLVIAASLMYHVEHDAQPGLFTSIPASMWWGVATLTTVGYGDMYPITPLGKLLAAMMAVVAVGAFALPAGILSSGFMEEIQALRRARQGTRHCPHCGGTLPDEE